MLRTRKSAATADESNPYMSHFQATQKTVKTIVHIMSSYEAEMMIFTVLVTVTLN